MGAGELLSYSKRICHKGLLLLVIMGVPCKCCNKMSEAHQLLTCCVCTGQFNHTCAGLTISEVRIIKSKKSLSWTCAECEGMGSDINSLKAVIISLRDEVKVIKNNLQTAESCSFDRDLFLEEVIQELDDRNKRKRNVLIFGLNEQSSSMAAQEVKINDTRAVQDVLRSLSPDSNAHYEVQRLGRADPAKSRPLKVTFQDENVAIDFIKRARELRNNVRFKNVFLSPDRTPRQMSHYRELRKQLTSRISTGETDIVIKYIHGIPKIVKRLN